MAWVDRILEKLKEVGGSDLHLSCYSPPIARIDGQMQAFDDEDDLSPEELRNHLSEIIPARNRKEFEEQWDTDFAYNISGVGRFRCNFFVDFKGVGAVFRIIPSEIPNVEALGLPESILKLCTLQKGLVLVTGPTGSGKSTTLAAMIDLINETRSDHIITVEDPIEFVHPNKKCLVNQREVSRHTKSFKNALRAALREDPDVVMVGEMRDLETIAIAIEMAETGHLVFGTLHTTTAASTVDRMIEQFPTGQQEQIRVMLAGALKGVVAQTLCRKKEGGRVAAHEILIINPALSAILREGKTHQIASSMQTGAKEGMRLLNDSLMELVLNGSIEPSEAYVKSVDREDMLRHFDKGNVSFVP